MKHLFFANTPAHVHLFRHPVETLREMDQEVEIFARDYGCTLELLEYHDLPYRTYGRCDTTKSSLFRELPRQYASLVPAAREFDPDLVFGVGAYAAHAGAVTGARTVLVFDSEPSTVDHLVSRPFATAMLTPCTFGKRLGDDHFQFRGFTESAYAHPEVFESSTDVRERLGLDDDEPFVVVRFNAFGSHHDVGVSGFTEEQRHALVEHLDEYATVFVSDEGDTMAETSAAREFDVHPALMHDALAEAELLVADTQTIVTEAAMLGTPAIRSNGFVGEDDMGNFHELAEQDLVHNLADFEDVLETTTALLTDPDRRQEYGERSEAYASELVNLSDLLVDIATHPAVLERPGTIEELRPATPVRTPARGT